ncbi:LOW QUALITY PROTEIN: hypothetical protein U9M48_042690, partial [Paspalum notatum var. saurae]
MLRACAIQYGTSWDKCLPYAEFSYNNSYQASVKKSPFEALYGKRCRTPLFWNQTGEKQVFGPDIIQDAEQQLRIVQENLRVAQSRQRSYADVRRRDLSFKVDDHVYLKVSPMRGIRRFNMKGKLAPRYIGPFKILEKKSEVAYRLELPPSLSGVHDVFHVSQLKKCLRVPEEQAPLEGLEVREDRLTRNIRSGRPRRSRPNSSPRPLSIARNPPQGLLPPPAGGPPAPSLRSLCAWPAPPPRPPLALCSRSPSARLLRALGPLVGPRTNAPQTSWNSSRTRVELERPPSPCAALEKGLLDPPPRPCSLQCPSSSPISRRRPQFGRRNPQATAVAQFRRGASSPSKLTLPSASQDLGDPFPPVLGRQDPLLGASCKHRRHHPHPLAAGRLRCSAAASDPLSPLEARARRSGDAPPRAKDSAAPDVDLPVEFEEQPPEASEQQQGINFEEG